MIIEICNYIKKRRAKGRKINEDKITTLISHLLKTIAATICSICV
jgi:hypothetical protein